MRLALCRIILLFTDLYVLATPPIDPTSLGSSTSSHTSSLALATGPFHLPVPASESLNFARDSPGSNSLRASSSASTAKEWLTTCQKKDNDVPWELMTSGPGSDSWSRKAMAFRFRPEPARRQRRGPAQRPPPAAPAAPPRWEAPQRAPWLWAPWLFWRDARDRLGPAHKKKRLKSPTRLTREGRNHGMVSAALFTTQAEPGNQRNGRSA